MSASFEKPVIVLAHGCFDVLHIGHIRHLQQAKTYGDFLIVSVTADEFVNKGDGRPFFNCSIRRECLESLSCVDKVVINNAPNASDLIRKLRPDVFIKGPECRYHTNPGLEAERVAIAEVGGEMAYTSGQIFSSTEIGRKVLEIA